VSPCRHRWPSHPARLRDDPGRQGAPRTQPRAVPLPRRSAVGGDPQPRAHRSFRSLAHALPGGLLRSDPGHRTNRRPVPDPALRFGTYSGRRRALEDQATTQEGQGRELGQAAVHGKRRRRDARSLRSRAVRPASRAGRRSARDLLEGRSHSRGRDRPSRAAGRSRTTDTDFLGRSRSGRRSPGRRSLLRALPGLPDPRVDLRGPGEGRCPRQDRASVRGDRSHGQPRGQGRHPVLCRRPNTGDPGADQRSRRERTTRGSARVRRQPDGDRGNQGVHHAPQCLFGTGASAAAQ